MKIKIILEFLNALEVNNNRNWFKSNEDGFRLARTEFENFIEEMISVLRKIDEDVVNVNAKDCIFRIYKDVRFSKDKNPYKTNFGAFIAGGGRKSKYAGYYIHIEPGKSFVGGGIYMPEPEILKKIRVQIFHNANALKKILTGSDFEKYFNGIYGEKLKTVPKGFPKDFKDIDLLKHKHYAVVHEVKDSFWNSKNLKENLLGIFKIQYPFNLFLNKAIENI